jgi:hypothetical protein
MLTEDEKAVFYAHVDPSNSDASADVLVEHVEKLIRRYQAEAWGAGYETGYGAGDWRLTYDPTSNPYRAAEWFNDRANQIEEES